MEVGGLLSSRGYDLWVCACDVGEAMTSLKHHFFPVLSFFSFLIISKKIIINILENIKF
jgi:hypothetical protein